MVKIAVAGGSGNVGREIIDGLIAAKKHDILVLSRKDAPETSIGPGVKWLKVSYDDTEELIQALQGVETVLSFVDESSSEKPTRQRRLIDASIQAGVKRFAPSEWASGQFEHAFWYAYKEDTRKYLADLNKDKKVLEYCLFIPGLFTNYLTFPYNSCNHVEIFELTIDFYNRRAIVPEGGENAIITFTTAQDLAKVVAQAVDYQGEWPVFGGIKGADMTVSEIIALGEKIRGPFSVEKLKVKDLEAKELKSSWVPKFAHPSVPVEIRENFAAPMFCAFMLGISADNLQAPNDAWNQLLPNFKFTQPEEFLVDAWAKIDAGAKSVHTE